MSLVRISWLVACLALCQGHAVVPVVPAVHGYHGLVAPYPVAHHGYGVLGHGLVARPLGHHLLKRSPHYVEPLAHAVPLAHAPLALSHQARVDVHAAPLLAPVPLVKPLLAPVLPVPVVHKTLVASPVHYGAGLHGGLYPHIGHY